MSKKYPCPSSYYNGDKPFSKKPCYTKYKSSKPSSGGKVVKKVAISAAAAALGIPFIS